MTVCGRARCGSSIVAPRPGWRSSGTPRRVGGWTRGPEPRDPGEGEGSAAGTGREARGGCQPRPVQRRRESCECVAPPLLGVRALRRRGGPRAGDRARGGRRAAVAGGGGREEGRGRGEGRARGAQRRDRPAEAPPPAASSPVAGDRAAEGAPSRAQGRGAAARRRRGRGVPAACCPLPGPGRAQAPPPSGGQPPMTCLLAPDRGVGCRAPRGHRGLR